MSFWDEIINRKKTEQPSQVEKDAYEFCPRCDANLTFQKGYDNTLPYWICRGCGEMLINPELETDSDIIWRCDGCEALLNVQEGFDETLDEWKCTECGYVNRLDMDEVYDSDDEYQAEMSSPYRGLSDEDMLALSIYQDEGYLDERKNIILVRDRETGTLYVKKLLTIYDKSIYSYLKDNPVDNMPRIIDTYESSNCLIVIEEYIEGKTLAEVLEDDQILETRAIDIVKSICVVLDRLHNLNPPIIHRDIKPLNIIITPDDSVVVLDMNAAKWYDPEKTEDTHFLGTQYYAAPEQVGFGMKASSARSDIYAVGMLLNVMITGAFPKEKKAAGPVWDVIERCISLEEDKRFSAAELIDELENLERK